MTFSDYKSIAQVQQIYKIIYKEENFITPEEISPSAHFIEEFTFNKEYFDLYISESSRCELIILPILREIYKPYAKKYSLWIQKSISYDDKLTGTPDYLIATRSPLGKTVLDKPLLILVEAKKNDFEQGWGQCAAELVAAQKLNDDVNLSVYGIVTDGRFWQFAQLIQNVFIQHNIAYSIDNLPLLFGVLNSLFTSISSITVNN